MNRGRDGHPGASSAPLTERTNDVDKKWIARTSILIGTILLTWAGVDSLRAAAYQRQHLRTLQNATAPRSLAHPPALGAPIGWLEVPRLGVSGAVVHGDADHLLKR